MAGGIPYLDQVCQMSLALEFGELAASGTTHEFGNYSAAGRFEGAKVEMAAARLLSFAHHVALEGFGGEAETLAVVWCLQRPRASHGRQMKT